MGESADRLMMKLGVVVPPHMSVTKAGKPVKVKGYVRRGNRARDPLLRDGESFENIDGNDEIVVRKPSKVLANSIKKYNASATADKNADRKARLTKEIDGLFKKDAPLFDAADFIDASSTFTGTGAMKVVWTSPREWRDVGFKSGVAGYAKEVTGRDWKGVGANEIRSGDHSIAWDSDRRKWRVEVDGKEVHAATTAVKAVKFVRGK